MVAQISGGMDPPWTCVCVVCMCGEGGWGPPASPRVAAPPRVASPWRSELSYRGYKLCATKKIAAIGHASLMPMHTRVA